MPVNIIVAYKNNPGRNYQWQETEWEQLKNEWVELNRKIIKDAAVNNFQEIEIFVCFRGDQLFAEFDFDFINRILDKATHSIWGAKIYIVIDRTIENIINDKPYWLNLEKFVDIALENRVDDIFEIGIEDNISLRNPGINIDLNLLLCAVNQIKINRSLIPKNLSKSGWDCIVPKGRILARAGGYNYFRTEVESRYDSKLLLYCSGRIQYARQFVKRILERHDHRQIFIANIENCFNNNNFQGKVIDLFDFRGFFDLYYFLRKQNQRRQIIDKTDIKKPVKQVSNPLFRSFEIQEHPKILLTNAFHIRERLSQEAAEEAGYLKKIFTMDGELIINPGIDFNFLAANVENKSFTVWMFQGHGEASKGLKDISEKFFNPEKILNCFKSYNQGLILAYFASCFSAETASLFATNGVGVSIGFDSQVTSFATKLMAEELLAVVVKPKKKNEIINEILLAFEKAADKLAARNLNFVKPIAYYSER